MSARLLALEALKAMQAEASARNCGLRICDEAIAALESETGKPVAWRIWSPDGANVYQYTEIGDGEPLYTAPPPAVPQWQPIKTAPKDGTGMLVFCPNSLRVPVTGGYWDDHPGCRCWIAGGYMQKVSPPTHWMPLPGAPA